MNESEVEDIFDIFDIKHWWIFVSRSRAITDISASFEEREWRRVFSSFERESVSFLWERERVFPSFERERVFPSFEREWNCIYMIKDYCRCLI